MKPKLTAEEIRFLRREVNGKGNLVASGFITITAAGRQWIAQDDERVKRERAEGGSAGGRPATRPSGILRRAALTELEARSKKGGK